MALSCKYIRTFSVSLPEPKGHCVPQCNAMGCDKVLESDELGLRMGKFCCVYTNADKRSD